MLLPNLPPPRLEGAGGHMVEDQSREGAPCLGTSQWHLVVTICLHGGTQLNPPSWLWCGEYSPSLTEIRVFWRPNIVCIPILRNCACFWHPPSLSVLLWRQRKGNSLRCFHFLQKLNKTKHYDFPLPGSRMIKCTNNIQLCTKRQPGK